MAARKITGMHKRAGSNNWSLRVMIPTALREKFYEGRAFARVSLNTPDVNAARTAALQVHATWADTFERQRAQLTPTLQANVPPQLAEYMAKCAGARVLGLDDAIRYDPEALGAFLEQFAPEPLRFFSANDPRPPRTVAQIGEDGMTPEQLQQLARIHDALGMGLSSALAHGQLKAGIAWADAEAQILGIAVDWSKNRPALLKIVQAVVGAWLDVGRKNLGAVVPTPDLPEIPADLLAREAAEGAPVAPARRPKGSKRSLWDVRDEWAAGKSKDAQAKMDRSLRKLEESGQWAPLEDLTRQHALGFRKHIQTSMADRSAKTRSDTMSNIQALLNFAVEEQGYLETNPWAGTAIAKGKAENKRLPWSNEDLSLLMASPIWQSYELPDDVRAGRDAAYWAPLIALYGGLRLSEVCQLLVDDVVQRDGVTLLDVNEASEDKSVKSAAGIRMVPVHSRLIALGFLNYVADMRDRAAADNPGSPRLLFPDLYVQPSRSGAIYFSDAFRDMAKSAGAYRRWRDFHGFRTTVSTFLRGVHPALNESLILALLGHEGANVGQTHYTVHAPKALQRAIEHLHFPALDALPRTYKPRVYQLRQA